VAGVIAYDTGDIELESDLNLSDKSTTPIGQENDMRR
jgi:hypothetical protein